MTTESKTLVDKVVDFGQDYIKDVVDNPLRHVLTASIAGGLVQRNCSATAKAVSPKTYEEFRGKAILGKLPLINVK